MKSIREHRPYFTFYMSFCQIAVMIIAILVYNIAPIAFSNSCEFTSLLSFSLFPPSPHSFPFSYFCFCMAFSSTSLIFSGGQQGRIGDNRHQDYPGKLLDWYAVVMRVEVHASAQTLSALSPLLATFSHSSTCLSVAPPLFANRSLSGCASAPWRKVCAMHAKGHESG